MCKGCVYVQKLYVCTEAVYLYRGCIYVQKLCCRDYRRQETWVQSLSWEDPLGGGNNNPLQYSCLENPMDRGAWWATVQSTAKSRTQLSDWACSGSLAPEMEWFLTRCKLDGLVVLSEMVIQSFHHYVLIHSFPFFFCHLVFPFPPPPSPPLSRPKDFWGWWDHSLHLCLYSFPIQPFKEVKTDAPELCLWCFTSNYKAPFLQFSFLSWVFKKSQKINQGTELC